MAETTPGPLIMVVQFVGFIGAYRHPGPFSPLIGGIVGSILTTWVTFVPCFFWVFLGAPYIERLRGNKRLNSALSAITAAVVGVVLNLAVWFSLHTLFEQVNTMRSWLKTSSPRTCHCEHCSLCHCHPSLLVNFLLEKGIGCNSWNIRCRRSCAVSHTALKFNPTLHQALPSLTTSRWHSAHVGGSHLSASFRMTLSGTDWFRSLF